MILQGFEPYLMRHFAVALFLFPFPFLGFSLGFSVGFPLDVHFGDFWSVFGLAFAAKIGFFGEL